MTNTSTTTPAFKPLIVQAPTVLHIDMNAGFKKLSEAADERLVIVRNIVEVLSVFNSSSDLASNDMANLFGSLGSLIDEAQGLLTAAYEVATTKDEDQRGQDAKAD